MVFSRRSPSGLIREHAKGMCGPNLSARISLLVPCLVKLLLGKLLMKLVLKDNDDRALLVKLLLGKLLITTSGKDSADRDLLVDLVLWTSKYPPPTHLFLISGDGHFSRVVHCLWMKNYNILVSNRETSSTALCNAASIMWQWNSLVRGRGLRGKQFNHPPDDIPGSWYGEPIGPVGDAFRDIEFEANSNTVPRHSEGFETESNQELVCRPRQIPKTVMAQIANILYSYPKGINIASGVGEWFMV